MISRLSDTSEAGFNISDNDNTAVYHSTKKWEWSFLQVSLMYRIVNENVLKSMKRVCCDSLKKGIPACLKLLKLSNLVIR